MNNDRRCIAAGVTEASFLDAFDRCKTDAAIASQIEAWFGATPKNAASLALITKAWQVKCSNYKKGSEAVHSRGVECCTLAFGEDLGMAGSHRTKNRWRNEKVVHWSLSSRYCAIPGSDHTWMR